MGRIEIAQARAQDGCGMQATSWQKQRTSEAGTIEPALLPPAISRRGFLRCAAKAGAGLVAAATVAEAGMLAEFLDWLRRKPSFSIPNRITSITITNPGSGYENPWAGAMMPFRAMFVVHQVGYDKASGLWTFGEVASNVAAP